MSFKVDVFKVFLKSSEILQGNNCVEVFLITLQVWAPATLLKKDSNIGVALWN